jgi:hypothetical protein
MTDTETTCAFCGLSDGPFIDLGTGSARHRGLRDCIMLLRGALDEKRRTIHDPYLAAVNADRVIELTASELRWRVAAERERERAENLTRKLDAIALALQARPETPADTPVTVASLVAQLVTMGAVEQKRYISFPSARPQDSLLHSEPWSKISNPVRILILPDAETDQTRGAGREVCDRAERAP